MRYTYSDHLVNLVAQAEAAAARLADADPDRRAAVAADARRESARLSARLDASPLEDRTADEVDAGRARASVVPRDPVPQAGGGGWARALRLDGMPTQEIAAVEYANLLACFDAEPAVAESFLEQPVAALRALHTVLCRGLLDGSAVGRPRRTSRAVHDGAQGRVLYHAAEPEHLNGLLRALAAWLCGPSAAAPALVVAGVVHERLLQWQPFEAANGRLARAASRLALRARGLDPHGLAVVERPLAEDVSGYHGEVAATIRRRDDLSLWLERYAEAAVAALHDAARAVDPRPRPAPPPRALALAAGLESGQAITVAEYATRCGVNRQSAHQDLRSLTLAGELRPVTRSRGLRFRRP